jgi:alanine-synthesizing transaminase
VSFSARTPSDLEPNALAEIISAKRAAGIELCDLTISNPTAVGLVYPAEAIDRALAAAGAGTYHPDPRGLPAAREAVVGYYRSRGQATAAEQLLLTASTSEAYAFLFKLLCDPGDEVLFPSPSYPLFDHLAALEGVVACAYALDESAGWAIDLDSLEANIGERSRAIVLVSPNNPTGSVVGADELAAIARLARRHGLAIIGDEVFADYLRPGEAAAPALLGVETALSFSLGGLSKAAAMPHLKLSWIAASGPRDQRDQALARLELIADTFLSVAAPVQRALPELLVIGAEIRERVCARVAQGFAQTAAAVAGASRARLVPARGGWYGLLALADDVDEDELCLDLLASADVLVHPGYFFDMDGQHLVLSMLTPAPQLERGLAAIVARTG